MEDIIREKEINTLVIVKNIKGESFKKYLIQNPNKVLKRFWENQYKLYYSNIQKLIIWDARTLYDVNKWSFFYKNIFFDIFLLGQHKQA